MAHEVREYQQHSFSGSFPEVATYGTVNLDLLTEGDDRPFFITLAIAQVGSISENGLLYDQALVEEIAGQLRGSGGIRGHIPEGEESTAFPFDAVDWVGHLLEEGKLWAKAYVPPGETREYIRRLKARGGALGTSIYGYGDREAVDDDVWRIQDFDLHSVDLAAAKRASLKVGGQQFAITAETSNNNMDNGGDMPNITINDIPDAIREQIIQEAQLQARGAQAEELVQQVADLESQITEMSTQHSSQETQISEQTTRVAELEATLAERETEIAAFKAVEFNSTLDARIGELTNWQVSEEAAHQKVEAVRSTLKNATLAELGDSRDSGAIEAALQAAFAAQQVIIETVRDALAGPNVHYGHDQTIPADGSWEAYRENPGGLTQAWGTSLKK